MRLTQYKTGLGISFCAALVCAAGFYGTFILGAWAEEPQRVTRSPQRPPVREQTRITKDANDKINQRPKNKAETRVRTLLKQRLVTLQEIADELRTVYERSGTVALSDVVQAQLNVLKGELELAQTPRARLDILEKIVALEKKREATLTKELQWGRAKRLGVLTARANRLEAEISLERARAGLEPSSKQTKR